MNHNHDHTICDHKIKLCSQCDVVFCETCPSQWCKIGENSISKEVEDAFYDKVLGTGTSRMCAPSSLEQSRKMPS